MPKLTHILQSPNKHYLGFFDLPEKKDLVLTIKSILLENVKDHETGKTEPKKIVHFEEDYKPLICNQTNAKAIFKATGEGDPEKCAGKRIRLFIGEFRGEPCVRVREGLAEEEKFITPEQVAQLEKLLEEISKDKVEWCKAVRVSSIAQVPASKFDGFVSRLKEIKEKKA